MGYVAPIVAKSLFKPHKGSYFYSILTKHGIHLSIVNNLFKYELYEAYRRENAFCINNSAILYLIGELIRIETIVILKLNTHKITQNCNLIPFI